jgi:hypothetical protein
MSMSIFKRSRNFGTILLGVWLIASGLLPLLGISIPHSGLVLNLLAIVAGVLILIDR